MRLLRPASTLPGPHSTTCVTPCAAIALDRLGPAHRARRLPRQRGADRVRRRDVRRRRRCGCTGIAGARERDLREPCGEPLGRGLQQRAVERRATPAAARRAWRPAPSRAPIARSTASLVAGDHDLARRVEVHRLDDLALRGFARTPRRRRRRRRPGSPPSRRRPPAPPPASPARESAPAAPRRANASAPAATSAVYSPRLWPATIAGIGAARREPRALRRDARGQHHRLRVDA